MSDMSRPVLQFDGILAALYRQYNERILDVLTIEIRCPHGCPKSILPLITGCPEGYLIGTANTDSGAYLFDFINQKVKLTGYIIKSQQFGTWGNNFPSNWIVEGSNDYQNYQPIHVVHDCKDLFGFNCSSLQRCEESPAFRFIRLRLTAPTSSESWHFLIGRIDFFGSLIGQGEAGTG
jgi:hypothetical protein